MVMVAVVVVVAVLEEAVGFVLVVVDAVVVAFAFDEHCFDDESKLHLLALRQSRGASPKQGSPFSVVVVLCVPVFVAMKASEVGTSANVVLASVDEIAATSSVVDSTSVVIEAEGVVVSVVGELLVAVVAVAVCVVCVVGVLLLDVLVNVVVAKAMVVVDTVGVAFVVVAKAGAVEDPSMLVHRELS